MSKLSLHCQLLGLEISISVPSTGETLKPIIDSALVGKFKEWREILNDYYDTLQEALEDEDYNTAGWVMERLIDSHASASLNIREARLAGDSDVVASGE